MIGKADVGNHPNCATAADDEIDGTFVDVVGDVCGEKGAESESCTFADALVWANRLCETILEGVLKASGTPLK